MKLTLKIALIGIIFLFGCDNITDLDPVLDPTIPVGYIQVWEDNFDQDSTNTSLDSEYWDYDLGYGGEGWGNDEWQEYTGSPDNIKVENGNMVISAQ